MNNNVNKISLIDLIKRYKKGILIPAIQRDYVMGAGGRGKQNKDKLESLLENMNKCAKNNEDFNFSCIISHQKSEKSKLEIYDGQQRLTTLIYMYIYKCRIENKILEIDAEWFEFDGRDKANEIFKKIVSDNSLNIEDIKVCDFTSFSIKNLLKTLNKYEYITSGFITNNVKFDMLSISSQNEIEQFFMDLNSGVRLKEFELYKSKLNHRVTNITKEWQKFGSGSIYKDCLSNWSYMFDNDWLDFFMPFASFEHSEEEYEVEFIRYLILMVNMEKKGYSSSDLDNIDDHINDIDIYTLNKVYNLMNNITKLNFKYDESYYEISSILSYSWGDEKSEDKVKKCNYDKRGAYWSLENNNYESMLYYVIKSVILDKDRKKDLPKDIVLWFFITTLNWRVDYQLEYLRIIKIILNYNVFINTKAWYECQKKGQYMYYCKNIVYGIPQYYGEHMKNKDDKYIKYFDDILNIHKHINNWDKKEQVKLNKYDIINEINMIINEYFSIIENDKSEEISNIYTKVSDKKALDNITKLLNRYTKAIDKKTLDEIIKLENMTNGIIHKLDLSRNYEDFNDFLEKLKQTYCDVEVTIEWPTSGNKNQEYPKGHILMKCLHDKLFDNIENKSSLKNVEYIEKKYWIYINSELITYKLIDRKSNNTITYNKFNSDSSWCYVKYYTFDDSTGAYILKNNKQLF